MNSESVVKFLNRVLAGDLLAVIASWASVISLLLTIYVAWSIRKIRNKYISRIRAPRFVEMLVEKGSILSDFANDFSNSEQEICDELARVDVRPKAMQGRMRGESKKAIKELRTRIRDYEKEPDSQAKFHLVYRSMQRVIEEVSEYQEELDFEH